MQVAVRPASTSRRACALTAVTVAAESACAASCKALAKAGERGKKSGVSQWLEVRGCPAGKFHRKQYPVKVIPSGKIGQLSCLVSTFLSRAASRKQRLFTPEAAKACCLDKLPSDRG